jgi:rod shape determining protein RodA
MFKDLDKNIYFLTILIMAVGLAALYSSTAERGQSGVSPIFWKQLWWSLLGILALFLSANFNYRRFYDLAYFIYGLTVILLLVVLVLGREILGAQRWLEIGGFNFQPSELGKLAIVIVLSRWFAVKKDLPGFSLSEKIHKISQQLLIPSALAGVLFLLVFLQPDLGTALLYLFLLVVMLFVAEVEWSFIVTPVIIGLSSLPFLWHLLKDYQRDRLRVFLNPNIDPLGAGYTIIQSKIAVGSGRLFGKGWLSGTQGQLSFLPERHTDFIFAVIGEEVGLIGSILIIFLFYLLIRSGIRIAATTKDRFGSLMATGIVSILAFQVVINIAMTIGMCPVVGLVLPFISYGGSSLIVFAVLVGILLNINKRRIIF